ncbi:YbaK/EbsC family protein [Pendulispora albinea]|uniref:YbaK/aminoacyl-tRNA synthetase-associated domain-containing protein n=1 Tax=Pendulispora albinea TaxID=2741071 RepID=A0ABZ2MBN0_9BACT
MSHENDILALEDRVTAHARSLGADFDVVPCDPALADTAAFCAHYGFELGDSANAILVASKSEPRKYAVCLLLANTRLDVNKAVCRQLDCKRASFADADETVRLTGMIIGGVTVFGLPAELPILVDLAVMARPRVIVGGGSRGTKLRVDPEVFRRMPQATVVENLALRKA